jgi:hypothetical protein
MPSFCYRMANAWKSLEACIGTRSAIWWRSPSGLRPCGRCPSHETEVTKECLECAQRPVKWQENVGHYFKAGVAGLDDRASG